jgi:hypothetical protein
VCACRDVHMRAHQCTIIGEPQRGDKRGAHSVALAHRLPLLAPPPVLKRQYPNISAKSAFFFHQRHSSFFPFFTGLGQGVAEIIASHVKVGLSVFVCPRLCASVLEGRMCGWW